MVLEATGQAVDVPLLVEDLTDALEWNSRRLGADESGWTSGPGLWAAGDVVRGPDVVSAVADGHRVAGSIKAFLLLEDEET